MNIEKLLKDYNIPFVLPGEHAHATGDSVNVKCPFCVGHDGYHMGFIHEGKICNCWRCGRHRLWETLSAVIGVSLSEIPKILKQYEGGSAHKKKAEPAKIEIHPLKYPSGTSPIQTSGIKYLQKRQFNPVKLVVDWDLQQTGPVSFLDKINYSHRILIPIRWNGKVVSFQTRDITNRSSMRYITCPKKRERVHHKNILYGKQEEWKNHPALIVVEGITDVWRLGTAAVATFGIEFKREQVLELAKAHDRFIIIFDNESQAQKQARKLVTKLKGLGKRVSIETVPGDPGEMKQEDADYLVKELLK